MVTEHEDLLTFMIFRSFRLRMRNVSDKSCIRMKTYFFLCSVKFFRTLYPLWVNVEKCCGAGESTNDNITQRMRIACWICKATNTYSEYAVLIAFPQPQWLHECALMFVFYIHCLPCLLFMFGNRLLHACSSQCLMATSASCIKSGVHKYSKNLEPCQHC
jgi:hypothetical protein